MLFESLTKVSKPCYSFRQPATAHVSPPSNGVFGRPVRTSLPWIPKNSPQSRIALVIKKLSKHQNLTQFWLELIARVLNMLIGLKGDNYYSKVFKRVNYKLSNSTFWVVITPPNRHIASPLAMKERKRKINSNIIYKIMLITPKKLAWWSHSHMEH